MSCSTTTSRLSKMLSSALLLTILVSGNAVPAQDPPSYMEQQPLYDKLDFNFRDSVDWLTWLLFNFVPDEQLAYLDSQMGGGSNVSIPLGLVESGTNPSQLLRLITEHSVRVAAGDTNNDGFADIITSFFGHDG
jgi:hypothetical protein